ncbi:MAG: SDR family oxidoreductase [Verrucomicrobia bacterium]|nr:SDR family oxidoreductase [Verrucomicrobiota bacterium]
MATPLILLTGATGYVGGRLLTELVTAGYRVRCLARRPENLRPRVPAGVEVVAGDLLDAASLPAAFAGVQVAYYLVHSMGSTGNFEEQDRQAAHNFGAAAKMASVQRIIYLGGLGDDSSHLSAHLHSRHEVGAVLRASGVPVTEFRASIIIGSGSLSFEMIRALVERLPVMITPRWVRVLAQPIFVGDVLAYLVAAATSGEDRIYEIGGPDVVSYQELMREYARQRGLRRWMIPVPVLTPRLSSLWLGLVTPLYARIGRKLIASIQHPTVVRDDAARRAFPIEPVGIREAITRALRNEDRECAQTRWSDAVSAAGTERQWGGVRFGNRLVDTRSVTVPATVAEAFAPIERIGGVTGWYYADWLWTLRGGLDLLVGGVGMRRDRRNPESLAVGDTVDCWRVEAIEPGRRLRLAAEMKLPGRAWLEFVVEPAGTGAVIRQTAIFDPVGLWGLLYWYAVWPLHQLVFAGMLRAISRASRQRL